MPARYRRIGTKRVCAHELTSNYDVNAHKVQLTDEIIARAQPFDGHGPVFLDWPKHLWENHEKGVPCEDPEKNAYHVQYLAKEMETARAWLGKPPQILADLRCRDGSHRVRAAKYLFAKTRMIFEVDAKVYEEIAETT